MMYVRVDRSVLRFFFFNNVLLLYVQPISGIGDWIYSYVLVHTKKAAVQTDNTQQQCRRYYSGTVGMMDVRRGGSSALAVNFLIHLLLLYV